MVVDTLLFPPTTTKNLDLFCQISRKTLSEDVRLNTGEHDVIPPHRKHACVGKRDRCYIMCYNVFSVTSSTLTNKSAKLSVTFRSMVGVL